MEDPKVRISFTVSSGHIVKSEADHTDDVLYVATRFLSQIRRTYVRPIVIGWNATLLVKVWKAVFTVMVFDILPTATRKSEAALVK